MAGFVFNIAKGRVGEFFYRVDTNDPTNSALIVVILAESGLESDAVLIDKDDLAAVLSGSTNETSNPAGYARKTLTDADLSAPVPDDSNDRFDYDIPDQTWSSVTANGTPALGNWRKFLLCYDSDTTAGTDANIIPMLAQDITVNPDGSNITLQIAATGIFRAQ